MSVKAIANVWGSSKRKGSELLLLLAIADNYNDDAGCAWPSIEYLARKCRMTTRNIQKLISGLTEDGDITVQLNGGPNGTNIYRLARIYSEGEGEAPSGRAKEKRSHKAIETGGGENFSGVKRAVPIFQGGDEKGGPPFSPKPLGTVTEPKEQDPLTPQGGNSKKEKPAASPEHQDFIEQWCDSFQMQKGRAYAFDGGRDGKAVKQLLERTKLSPDDLVSIALKAWGKSGPGFWNCQNQSVTISKFNTHFNEIQEELSPQNKTNYEANGKHGPVNHRNAGIAGNAEERKAALAAAVRKSSA